MESPSGLEQLSPFQLKDELIRYAKDQTQSKLWRRRVRPRAHRLRHWRQLPRARSHAGARRAHRPAIPCQDDVQRPSAGRSVRSVRRRRRDGSHLLRVHQHRSSRLERGMVLRNNEVDDDKLGFVASGEINAPKSRVLLQLALMVTKDPARVQKMFDEY